ncbi:MAG: DUF1287 domain-containing protein [Verrucomicrobia bacterium]|nr:DUF1287 domain-containing protein [Verrucomicrobiota bacterium]
MEPSYISTFPPPPHPDIFSQKNQIAHAPRRVPNLKTYFERSGYSIDAGKKTEDDLPGDLVTCTVGGRPHIMVVSNKKTSSGIPLVIHNIGAGTKEENRLFDFPITGHYRIKSGAKS